MAEQHVEQQFLEYVVKSIVNHPNDVVVERTVDDRGVLLTLHINSEDMPHVIGREGQTAVALRRLLKKVGKKVDAQVNMKIFEPEEARRAHLEHKASISASAPAATVIKPAESSGLVTEADLNDLGI